jgi:hypothetical protein
LKCFLPKIKQRDFAMTSVEEPSLKSKKKKRKKKKEKKTMCAD